MNSHGYLAGKGGTGRPVKGRTTPRVESGEAERADCHKFKQQLTFRVGLFPQNRHTYLYRGERPYKVSFGTAAPWKRCMHASLRSVGTRRKEWNDRRKGKRKKEHDTSFRGYRLNCSLNAVPDLLIIAAAAGYLYYYPLSICHFIFLLEKHPRDF